MKFALAPVVALGLAASSAFAQLTINTPASAVVCQPLLLAWSGGTPPYFLSILPGNAPSSPALMNFPSTSATSLTFLVNIQAGTSLGLTLRDSTGAIAQSAPFTVQSGTDTSCLGQSSSVSLGSTASAGASSTGQTTGATPTTTQLTPTTSANSPKTSVTSGTSKTSTGTTGTTASGSSPSKSAGASRVSGQVAAAGVVGAALIALLG